MEFDHNAFKKVMEREVLKCGGDVPIKDNNIQEVMKEPQVVLEEPLTEEISVMGNEIDEFFENFFKKPGTSETMEEKHGEVLDPGPLVEQQTNKDHAETKDPLFCQAIHNQWVPRGGSGDNQCLCRGLTV